MREFINQGRFKRGLTPVEINLLSSAAGTAGYLGTGLIPNQTTSEGFGNAIGSVVGSSAGIIAANQIQDSLGLHPTNARRSLALLAALGVPITASLLGRSAGSLFNSPNVNS